MEEKLGVIAKVTKKSQVTIPEKLRQKYGITDKARILEGEEGLVIKHLPTPAEEFGSLKHLFAGKTAREIVEEGRKQDYERDRRLQRLVDEADKRKKETQK